MTAKLSLLVFLFPYAASAGVCSADPLPSDTRHDFMLWAGYSPQSTHLIGTQTDRQFFAAGFTYSYRCWPWRHVSLSYAAGILPAAIVFQPARAGGQSVYGFALTPIGLSLDFARSRKVYPFAVGDAGFIKSNEPIPLNLPGATSFNFLFDYGGGVKVRAGSRLLFTAGYKFLHISNAGSGNLNPGLDNNLFYGGVSFLK